MKEIFARIFAAWALLIFIITMIPVSFFMWLIGIIKEPRRTSVFRIISKIWMRVFFFSTGCRLKIVGLKNFKKGENYIVACNHNSLMDVPLTTPFIPGANKTIAKAEMAKIPVFGLIYKRGSILVDRNDKSSRRNSFKKMKEVLNMGMHVCIYPEGTRNKTKLPLKEFHDGAFKLAVETGTPILPSLIFNTKKVLPPGKAFFFWPSKMELHFLPEVRINEKEDFELMKSKIYELMSSYYTNRLKEMYKAQE
ncbi:MAG: 1-acyl-sn-glycerol-3-phosphate acyltransferase [Bacteroidota bacterium]|nr:1-acyl-sn-glycerol-3-phosphate acyltransferase [Bacteroidota bacterium]MDQ6889362.1 1-acyl-sn-glycerol-3-phosphate acyltransferase [Bacteroidota bacterium]